MRLSRISVPRRDINIKQQISAAGFAPASEPASMPVQPPVISELVDDIDVTYGNGTDAVGMEVSVQPVPTVQTLSNCMVQAFSMASVDSSGESTDNALLCILAQTFSTIVEKNKIFLQIILALRLCGRLIHQNPC